MPITISPDLLKRGPKPPAPRTAFNFSAARAGLDALRPARLKALGIGGGLKYGAGPAASGFALTAMAPMIAGKGRLEWDHSENVGIDIWGDQHPYVGFRAIFEAQAPGDFAVVQPSLSIFVEPIAQTLLIEVACQAYHQDGTSPAIRVWTGHGEESHQLANGKPDSFGIIATPGSGSTPAAILQMDNPQVVPLPKSGGNWAMFEVHVSPLVTG